jgi:predicted amidophosphoribosyltransferase
MAKTYLCPECGRELEKGAKCPECGKEAKGVDLLKQEQARQQARQRAREKYGDRAGLFKV